MTVSITPSKHPSSAVLLDYASATLGFAHRLVVETHVLHCQGCAETISFLKGVGNEFTANLPPVTPPADLFERSIASFNAAEAVRPPFQMGEAPAEMPRIVDRMVLPSTLKDLQPSRLRWLTPGIRHSTLWRDDFSTLHFIRVNAGVKLPAHSHRGLELTCVLRGAFRDNDGLYSVGDVAEEDEDYGEAALRREHDHLVRAEPQESCMCILATTGRLHFSNWMIRLVQFTLPF
ncbi:ChrR family anti-sigma-E factor [Lichenicoccus roseus]|uniref:ChrR family anti-sigma-E factor n=1 Tax=Lichenicoccus roseus TaxID=2683649 RepID=UPI00148601E6|nr:ChrR family anti-sigma-E factor [Lichenicoccus roseus]